MKQRNHNEKRIRRSLLTLAVAIAITTFIAITFPQVPNTRGLASDRDTSLTQQKTRLIVERQTPGEGGALLFTGTGFEGFEPIEIRVYLADMETGLVVTISEWLAFSDARGNLVSVNYLPAEVGPTQFLEAVASGVKSGLAAKAVIVTGELAVGADIDQCANGGIGQPPVQCAGAAWVNGNLNSNKAHYVEGQVVPFRMRFSGLSIGKHTVTIGYDTTESGKHAYDFLARYNYTEANADPCDAGNSCTGPESTYMIPADPNIPLALPLNPPELPAAERYFSMWGGTITAVGTPTITSGDYTGTSRTEVTITFTAAVENPVLAWGGHLARRVDWGNDASAAAIDGSPFHMRLIALDGTGGNQDRSIQSGAVIYPARITIYKHAAPPSTFEFSFTATNLPLASFTLVDDSATTDAMRDFTGIEDFALTRRITESSPDPYTLRDIMCTVIDVSGITGTTANVSLPYVDILSKEASTVNCTFFNDLATAAEVDLNGTVLDTNGRGVRGAFVSLTNQAGISRFAVTNMFGNFVFGQLDPGESYYIDVAHKTLVFDPVILQVSSEMKRLLIYPAKQSLP